MSRRFGVVRQIAFVVADDLGTARNAGETIEIDYEPLGVVTDAGAALSPGAPRVWPDIEGNLAFVRARGNKDATDAAFAKAAQISRVEIVNNRVVANYMETRGIVAEYDPGTDRYTLTLGTQGGERLVAEVARNLQGALPSSSILGRLGPDRFALLLPGSGAQHALETAARGVGAASHPIVIEEIPIEMECAAGAAVSPGHGEEASTLLQHAEIALDIASRGGLGATLYDPAVDPYSRARLGLLGDLRKALEVEPRDEHLVAGLELARERAREQEVERGHALTERDLARVAAEERARTVVRPEHERIGPA